MLIKEKKIEKEKKKFLLLILEIIIAVLSVLLLFSIWYIFDNKNENEEPPPSQLSAESNLDKTGEFLDLSNNDPEVGGIVEKVSRHILLPDKEFTVATVNDASALQQENPILYQYVQNGQKMVIYSSGIIVYDPVIDKLVDVIQFYPVRAQVK